MTPQELRSSILQLAIQGKLVEQRPEEGTGEELYQQIQAEKKRLIQEGKIKKEKPLPEIAEDEVPFEIPEGWKWVRLGDVASVLGGKRIPAGRTLTTENTGYKYIRVSDMKNGSVSIDSLLYVPSDIYPSISRYIINKEDVYITVAGTIGRVGKIPQQIDGSNLTENADRLVFQFLDQDWLIRCLESQLIQQQIIDATTKVGQPKLAIKRIQELLLPLPPVAEQKRIVAKIEELLPYLDRYEKAWNRLEEFNRRFPADMQKSILQMAIQGKLVEQRPEEGTGEELYRQIQAEKQALIKAGKIKKEKPLPEIAEDEVPFEIPEGWKWVRLNTISEAIVDCPHSTPHYIDLETPYCTIDTNCINEKGEIIKWRYVEATTYSIRIARLAPQKDDIIYTREGSICRAAILPDGKNICMGQRVMLIRCATGVFSLFLQRILMAPTVICSLTEKQKGIGAKHINVSDVCNLFIPLPPLAEQKRIVARLEEILPLCEKLD